MKKVYLAGKIYKSNNEDWRTALDIAPHSSIAEFYKEDYGTDRRFNDNHDYKHKEFITNGPFFVACDHGCYHGEGKHGVVGNGCSDENSYTRADVLKISKHQIDSADFIFVWIDSMTAFGTVAEVGYAHANGKKIFTAFANKELAEHYWFMGRMSSSNGCYVDVNEAFEYFVKWSDGKLAKTKSLTVKQIGLLHSVALRNKEELGLENPQKSDIARYTPEFISILWGLV